jgi:hypothetical protein
MPQGGQWTVARFSYLGCSWRSPFRFTSCLKRTFASSSRAIMFDPSFEPYTGWAVLSRTRRAPAGSHTALRPAKFNPVLRHDRRRLGDRTQARYGLAAKSVIEDLIRSRQSLHPPQAGHRKKWSACPSADRRAACRDICRAGERDVSRNCSAHSSRGAVDRADAGPDPGRFHEQPGGDRAGY